MGTIYQDLENLQDRFEYFRGSDPNNYKLFIIGEDEGARLNGCQFTKRFLGDMLEAQRKTGESRDYEVCIIDLVTDENPDYATVCGPFWDIFCYDEFVFVPIFHNSRKHLHLPQVAFDKNIPGIFSLSREEYRDVDNPSKRDCYDMVNVK